MRKRISNIESTLHLSDKVLIMITFTFIVITLSLASFSIETIRKKKIDEIKKYINSQTTECAKRIDTFFVNKFESLEAIASFKEIYGMNWEVQREILKETKDILNFDHIFIVDNEGKGYYTESNEVKDHSKEPFFNDINSVEKYLSEPYSEPEYNKAIITLSMAIYDEEMRVGTLCGVIDLKEINEMVQSYKIRKTENAFVINEKGEYVASNNKGLVYNKTSVFEESWIGTDIFKAKEKNKQGVIKLADKEYYLSYVTLENNTWKAVFIVERDEVLADVRKIEKFEYSIVGSFIIITLLIIRIFIKFINAQNMGYIDSLTGLNNRNKCEYIFAKLKNEIKHDIVVIAMDLNGFKMINDTMGHNTGDKALGDFAKILKKVFQKKGFIGRMGGDEFMVLLKDYDFHKVEGILKELDENIQKYNKLSNNQFKLSVSYGYAMRKKGEEKAISAVYAEADEIMYKKKRKSKN